jgi:uncharacterized protein (DUF2126 family)
VSSLRKTLTFGFECTFTIPNWWQSPGFCSECETDEKTKMMLAFASELAVRFQWRVEPIKDAYGLDGFQIYDQKGQEQFKFTSEPGSIEVNTPPVLIDGVVDMIKPLLEAAEKVGFLPYRTWWYGIKTGTGGGCHLNMAGFTEESNPFHQDLSLVLKYFSYFHNRPSLHYPFMGPDIGKGGNCMRVDEQGEASPENFARFHEAVKKLNEGWKPEGEELFDFFKGFPLREVKHSAPTLRKMKSPWHLIEDRAVEMPRTPEEFLALCELRMRILETLQNEKKAELPKEFGPDLHEEIISYTYLWKEFQAIAKTLQLESKDYQVFFERQFPKLFMGESVPKHFYLREGKRERKVLGAQGMLGTLVLSKKIDSRYKRIEIHPQELTPGCVVRVNGFQIPLSSEGVLLDLFVPNNSSLPEQGCFLDIEICRVSGEFLERAVLDLRSFLYVNIPQGLAWKFETLPSANYHNFDLNLEFTRSEA